VLPERSQCLPTRCSAEATLNATTLPQGTEAPLPLMIELAMAPAMTLRFTGCWQKC
jgi:hypothetical protein